MILLVRIQDSKAVVDVRTESVVDVLWLVLANALPIPSPVCVVAHNLHSSVGYLEEERLNNLKMLFKTGHLDVLRHGNRLNNLNIDTASWPMALYRLLGLCYHSFNLVEIIFKKMFAGK